MRSFFLKYGSIAMLALGSLSFLLVPGAPVTAQTAICTSDDIHNDTKINVEVNPDAAIQPTQTVVVTGQLIFQDKDTMVRCRNQKDISFKFTYDAPGYTIKNASYFKTAKEGSLASSAPATGPSDTIYYEDDIHTFSDLTGQTTISSDAALSFTITAFKGSTQVQRSTIFNIPVKAQAAGGGGTTNPPGQTKPPGQTTPPVDPVTGRPPTTPTPATGAACPDYGDNFHTIPGTKLCVPDSPIGNKGLAGSQNIFQVIALVLRVLLILSGVLAVLFIVIGGFWYLTSAGNEEQAAKGRKAITYAILGLVLIVLSYTIVAVLVKTLSTNPEDIIKSTARFSSIA